jgi:hypothetical protein
VETDALKVRDSTEKGGQGPHAREMEDATTTGVMRGLASEGTIVVEVMTEETEDEILPEEGETNPATILLVTKAQKRSRAVQCKTRDVTEPTNNRANCSCFKILKSIRVSVSHLIFPQSSG